MVSEIHLSFEVSRNLSGKLIVWLSHLNKSDLLANYNQMVSLLLTLIVLGVIGYLIVNYVPMVEPIKTVVIIVFVVIAIVYLLQLVHGVPATL